MTDNANANDQAAPRRGHGNRPPDTGVLVCPKCQGAMRTYNRSGIIVELCEDCRGIFLDGGELERLIDTEGGGWSGILDEPGEPSETPGSEG